MTKQKKSKIVNLISLFLLLLLLVGGIGAICHFAGISKEDITDLVNPAFRVEYDGKVYKTDTENNVVALPTNSQARFEVKGVKGYTVAVVPNVTDETDFTYLINGKTYPYSGENLALAFDINYYDGAFAVVLGDDFSLEYVLSRLWGTDTDTVTVGEHGDFPFYKFVVTSISGEVIELPFGSSVLGLTIPDTIYF